MRKRVITIILSILYSFFLIIGNSFARTNSFELIKENLLINVLAFIGIGIIFYIVINILFNYLDKKKKNKSDKPKSKILKLFEEKTFIFSLLFIIVCWLPYIIAYYPVILSPDPSFQIKQYFGIPNKYSTYSIMIDPSVTITNHHPVIHTLLLGSCVKIGTIIGSVNVGLFIYSLIQIAILSCTLAYTIKFLKSIGLSRKYLIATLLVYAFVPSFCFYSVSAVKDVIFSSLIILYIIALYKIVKSDNISNKNIIKVILLLILIVLFRNNGIHTILLSLPFLLFLRKGKNFRLRILLIIVIIFGFNYSYNNIILPYFKITPTSIRESLSIPFQQTARYVKEHSDEMTTKEKNAIDKILGYSTLASRYKPELSDPVKNEYNKYATEKDLKEYFKVWFYEFKKHPKTYIEATINNTYGYYYPLVSDWYYHDSYDTRITEDGFDYHYNNLSGLREILTDYGQMFQKIPVLSLLINIGFNVWLLLFMFSYLLYKKNYRGLLYLLPSLVLVLVCIASPANTYFRYAMPYVFALMLNFGIFIKESKDMV